ncbi:MAG: glucose-1-phosphate thymidylyltransferase RfbA [Akkermansiaceae bacterium]
MKQSFRKGILLAGGTGSRLYPLTIGVSKHLLPVHDKPMIFYSLSLLMLADIREVLVITTDQHKKSFEDLLGDGSQWGIRLQYEVQEAPRGIAEALILAKDFLDGSPCCLVLGDNLLYGHNLTQHLVAASQQLEGAHLLVCHVTNPAAYGVIELDEDGVPVSIEEKPEKPKSQLAVTGVYFYDEHASDMAATIRPSARGELEITDLNRLYMEKKALSVQKLNRGFAWFDTGTHRSISEASGFIQAIENRMGLKIGCPEEVAYLKKWITAETIMANIEPYGNSDYSHYLKFMLKQDPNNHL